MMITVDGETETRYYYLHDAQGSVVALLNNSGSVVEGYTYGPYGEPTVHTAVGADSKWLTSDDTTGSSSAYDNPYMFTARRYDEESGNYYYRARMYHPDLGRFLQPDPIGYYDSMNLYQYCLNNSINLVDPLGLWNVQIGGAVGIGAQINIGYNSGQLSGNVQVGVGFGAIANVGLMDTGTVPSGPSGHVTANANAGVGVASIGASGDVDVPMKGKPSASVSGSAGVGPVVGTGTVGTDGVSGDVGVSFGGMVFMGGGVGGASNPTPTPSKPPKYKYCPGMDAPISVGDFNPLQYGL